MVGLLSFLSGPSRVLVVLYEHCTILSVPLGVFGLGAVTVASRIQ